MDHAQVIADTIRGLNYDLALDMEAFLAEHAARLTVEQLKIVAAELLAAAAPEASDEEAAKKRAAQRLNLSETLGGMWRLDGWLDPEAGIIIAKAIEQFTRKPDPDGDVLTESIGHRRAEALLQMARHATAHAEDCNGQGGGRHSVLVGIVRPEPARPARRRRHPRRPTPARRHRPAGWPATPRSSPPSTAPTPKSWTSAAAPAPSPPGYAVSSSPVTADACSPAATGHRPGPKSITGCSGPKTKAKPNPENLEMLCLHHHHKVHEGGWTITIGHDQDRTPWFHPPDGRPPLKGQRRPMFRSPIQSPRRT